MPLRRLLPLLVACALLVTACGGSSSSDVDPATALKTAQQKLSSTSGVRFSLTTGDLPDGVQGVKSATGTVTDAPAFDGTLGVVTSAGSFSVPVRAVDGKVYARIPLTPAWSEVAPGDYGAPDPAQLTSADQGIPAILAATTDPKAGDQVRGGTDNKEVLTTYTGTVPGSAVAHLIPGASGDTFRATYAVTSDGELRQAALTGVFYDGKPSLTYTLVLTDYGTTADITAP
ncbi:MAG TPA: LppX_LprAFG lipoprotein [Nocardioides sp.]|jgi:lipoprotein LprG|nr:LppX_LprAFG lipoprotein [Nocardioides sp.]